MQSKQHYLQQCITIIMYSETKYAGNLFACQASHIDAVNLQNLVAFTKDFWLQYGIN